jgi:plasmid stabilization system protein ParE
MKLRIVVRSEADKDVESHARYLAEHGGIETALTFYKRLEQTFTLLATFPEMGKVAGFAEPLTGTRAYTFQSPRCVWFLASVCTPWRMRMQARQGAAIRSISLKGGNRIRWRRIRTLYQLIDSRTHFARQSFAVCKQIPDFGYPLNSDY